MILHWPGFNKHAERRRFSWSALNLSWITRKTQFWFCAFCFSESRLEAWTSQAANEIHPAQVMQIEVKLIQSMGLCPAGYLKLCWQPYDKKVCGVSLQAWHEGREAACLFNQAFTALCIQRPHPDSAPSRGAIGGTDKHNKLSLLSFSPSFPHNHFQNFGGNLTLTFWKLQWAVLQDSPSDLSHLLSVCLDINPSYTLRGGWLCAGVV